MLNLAKDIKARLEKVEGYALGLELEFFMEQLTEIAERKDYYMKQSWVKEGDLEVDMFKVWEIKDSQLLGDIIDQVERNQRREILKKRKEFKYVLGSF